MAVRGAAHGITVLGAVFALLACRSAPPPAPPLERLAGPHFEIVCHLPCGGEIEEALAAAEGAWSMGERLFGRALSVPAEPYAVHLYSTEDYQRVEARITGGRFRDNLAFTRSGTSHLALQPEGAIPWVGEIGIPAQTLRLIAHEAFHLIGDLASPAADDWPDWFDEGLATYAESEVGAAQGFLEDGFTDPWYGTYAWRVWILDRDGELPGLAATLRSPEDRIEGSDAYALHAMMIRFLAEERPALLEELVEAITPPPGSRINGGMASALGRVIDGAEGDEALDRAWRAWVGASRDRVRWIEIARTLESAGAEWTQSAFSRRAVSWRRGGGPDQERSSGWEIEGAVTLFGPEGTHALVHVGPIGPPYLTLQLSPDSVILATEEGNGTEADRRRVLASAVFEDETSRADSAGRPPGADARADLPAAAGGPLRFHLALADGRVTAQVRRAGSEAALRLDAPLPTIHWNGHWGLAVSSGGNAVWRGVEAGFGAPGG